MEVLTTILYVIFSITSVVLVLIVLIQDEGGEGFGGIFGGGSTTPFGSRSGNVLTKFTSILAALFILICVVLGLLNKSAELEATPDFEAETETADPLIQTDDYTVEDTGAYAPEGAEVGGSDGEEASSGGSLGPLSPDLLIDKIVSDEKEESE
ncbi:MAG: preprotein translocase subunit SecG [Spirochaetales bacterium]|nr:preprotein translocase subunit SecG [Spirochaetales bacterium]